MKKLLFIVLDGASDVPCKELKGLTPLESAKKPNIDSLALIGSTGLMDVIDNNTAPESDTAVMSILGYNPKKYYKGRGPIEALGFGIDFLPGELIIRCNFGSINEKGEILDFRATGVASKTIENLCKMLNRRMLLPFECSFKLIHTVRYRAILAIKSKKRLSEAISNTHPGYIWEPGTVEQAKSIKENAKIKMVTPLDKTKEAELTSLILNDFIARSHKILNDYEINIRRKRNGLLPVNIILTRGAGIELPKLFNLTEEYGVVWSALADMPVEKGIAKLAGMEVVNLPEPSKNTKKDMKIRIKKLLSNLEDNDALYIHLKGPDNYAHAKQPGKKKRCIELIDKHFFGPLLERIKLKETIVCITCDHTTSSVLGNHTNDPVPVLIAGPKVEMDSVKKFSEKHCKEGILGRINGTELMPLLMEIYKKKDFDNEL